MAEIVLTEPAFGQIYISRNLPSTYLYVSNIANGIVTFNNVSISNDNRFNISVSHPTISLDDFTPFRISDAQRRPPVSLKSAHEVGVLNENWCKKNYELDVSNRVLMGGADESAEAKKTKANENAVENHIAVVDKPKIYILFRQNT